MKPNAQPGRRLGVVLSLLACCLASGAVDLSQLQVGVLRREVYTNIPGPHLTNLLHHPKFPNHPDEVGLVSWFEAPSFVVEMYGQRISGYLLPPYSGEYTFYLSSDDQGALYLSTNDSPANKVLIASEPTWSPARSWVTSNTRTNRANISAPIHLEQGRAYYVEAIMKEVVGGDSLGVAWQVPGQPEPANGDWPISGQYIAIKNGPEISLAEAVDFAGDFETTPGEPWIGQNSITLDGTDAAQAAVACCEFTSGMWLRVHGPARLTFWYKIRTAGANLAELNIVVPDTGYQNLLRGDSDWQQHSLIISREATVYWSAYFENADPANGTGIWVDQVQVEPLTGSGAVDTTFPIVLDWTGPDIDCGPVVSSMAKQPDGKTIIVGLFDKVTGVSRNHIARLLPSGLLDTTFHANSVGQLHGIDRVGLQPDGGIIISGGVSLLAEDYTFLQRLHPDGRADTNFSLRFDPATTFITGMTVQPDGKILLSGSFSVPGKSVSNNVARLNANGSVDSTFQSALEARAAIGKTVPQPDGRIVVLFNWLYQPPGNSNLIARLNADGSVDTTFEAEIYGRGAYAAKVLPNGQMLVGGNFIQARDRSGAVECPNLVKLDASGRVDRTFASAAPNLRPSAIEVQADGKILLGGNSLAVPPIALARLHENGRLDESFVRGTITPEFGGRSGISGIVPQNDGSLLVGGYFSAYNDHAAYGLVRLTNENRATIPARELQERPAIATDGANYFVVWMDRRHRQSSWTEYDIFGARVSATGEVLDPDGIPICTNGLWQTDPVVGFDGENYLVVWSEIDGTNEWNIRGARVSRAGVVLDPEGITLCNQPGLQSNPDVAFNGSVYLVTWCDWRNQIHDGPNPLTDASAPDIYAARLTRSGEVLDNTGFAVTREPYGQWGAHITSMHNDFLVVWQDDALRGARVTQQGTVSLPLTLIQGSNSTPAGVGLSPAGFPMPAWLSWTEIRLKPDNTYLTDVFGARINPSNSVIARVMLATNAGEPAYVACDRSPASGFWSVWETRSGGPTSDIRGAWIPMFSSSGIPRPITVCTNAGTQDQPAISCNSNGCLVVWRDGRHLPPDVFPYEQSCDIYGAILTSTGTVLHGSSFLVSSELRQRTYPLIVWSAPSSITYGTRLSTAQLNATANASGTFTYNPPLNTKLEPGTYVLEAIFTPDDATLYNSVTSQVTLEVTPAPLVISADSKAKIAGTANPELTASYHGFVDSDTPETLDIPVTLSTAATIDSKPGVYVIHASGAWDPHYDIVHSNGWLTVLAPTNIAPAWDNQEHPAVASDGRDFLVVWMDRRNRTSAWSDYDIYGARVTSAGEVLDRAGIPICTLPEPQFYPSVAFDGTNYLVVWSDGRDGAGVQDIYGARISRDGVLLETNGIRITHGEIAYQPTVAFNGTEYLVTAYAWEHNGSRQTALLGVRVTPGGLVRDFDELTLQQPASGYPAICVSAGRDWLVAWNRYGEGVEGVFLRGAGSLSPTIGLVPWGSTGVRGVGVVGTNYYIATTQTRPLAPNTFVTDVYGTWISGTGEPGRTKLIGTNTNTTVGGHEGLATHYQQEHPSVTALGADALVVWDSGGIYTNGGIYIQHKNIVGTRVTPSGAALPPFTVCSAPGEQALPAVANNGALALAVWQDGRSADPNEYSIDRDYDIYGARITLTNSPAPQNGFLISSDAPLPLIITWAPPDPITYGTALSSDQLNARANVAGTLTYSPPLYTVLKPGMHSLRVTFTPANLEVYSVTNIEVTITVQRAPLLITVEDKKKVVGQPNPRLTAHYSGLVWPDWYGSDLETPVTLYTAAESSSPVGSYPIFASGAADPDYDITYVNGTLHVVPLPSGPGSYDVTFPSGPHGGAVVYDIATGPGDCLMIGGNFADVGGIPRRNVARLLPDGTPDPNFSGPPSLSEPLLQVLPQPDGRVVIAGLLMDLPERRYGLARLNADGTPDAGFTPPTLDETIITALALQRDGRILVGGWLTLDNGFSGHAVARLHVNGALDETLFIPLNGWICDVIVQPDERLIVAGAFSHIGDQETGGLARTLPDGSLDPTFHQKTGVAWPDAALLDQQGRILLSCHLGAEEAGGNGLYRFNSDGTLDTSFIPLHPAWMTAIAVQTDGRILCAGYYYDEDGVERPGVIRLRSEGGIDDSFQAAIASGAEPFMAKVTLQKDGRIVVGGTFDALADISCNGLARLNNDQPAPWASRTLPAVYLPGAVLTVHISAVPASNVTAYAIQDEPPSGWTVAVISDDGVLDSGKVKFGPYFDHVPRSLTYAVLPPAGDTAVKWFTGTASADGRNTALLGDTTIQAGGPHPADAPPANYQLLIEEITHYAAAWRQGVGWMRGPNPIPMDYVTRAAALWRAGECYSVDANAPRPPLIWVECTPSSSTQIKVGAGQNVSVATSAINGLIAAGEPFTVSITATPAFSIAAYAVEDQVPVGWSVTNLTLAGAFDETSRSVRWGPFTDGITRVFQYTAVPPVQFVGSAAFSGSMSCDGASIGITGTRSVPIGARLRICVTGTNCQIALEATGGRTYIIETSIDLTTWQPLMQVAGDQSAIPVDRQTPGRRFYRARPVD